MGETKKDVLLPPTLISTIPPIETSRNFMPMTWDQLEGCIEAPLKNACRELWFKGIRTLSSSANKKNVDGVGHLIIDYETLSEENTEVVGEIMTGQLDNNYTVQGLIEDYTESGITYDDGATWDGRRTVTITFPINEDTSANQVEYETNVIAAQFKQQPALWVKAQTLEEIMNSAWIGVIESREDAETVGYYFDPVSGLYYPSRELYELTLVKAEK